MCFIANNCWKQIKGIKLVLFSYYYSYLNHFLNTCKVFIVHFSGKIMKAKNA